MNFETAGVLEIGYEKRWTSMSEEQHGTRHYTNVVNYRNRFKIWIEFNSFYVSSRN